MEPLRRHIMAAVSTAALAQVRTGKEPALFDGNPVPDRALKMGRVVRIEAARYRKDCGPAVKALREQKRRHRRMRWQCGTARLGGYSFDPLLQTL
jgi:hypothetical protein